MYRRDHFSFVIYVGRNIKQSMILGFDLERACVLGHTWVTFHETAFLSESTAFTSILLNYRTQELTTAFETDRWDS